MKKIKEFFQENKYFIYTCIYVCVTIIIIIFIFRGIYLKEIILSILAFVMLGLAKPLFIPEVPLRVTRILGITSLIIILALFFMFIHLENKCDFLKKCFNKIEYKGKIVKLDNKVQYKYMEIIK